MGVGWTLWQRFGHPCKVAMLRLIVLVGVSAVLFAPGKNSGNSGGLGARYCFVPRCVRCRRHRVSKKSSASVLSKLLLSRENGSALQV